MGHNTNDNSRLSEVIVDHDLLAAQKQTFDELGYVMIPGALPADQVTRLCNAIEELRETLEQHPQRSKVEGGLNIRPVIDKHAAFFELLIAPRTFAAVAAYRSLVLTACVRPEGRLFSA
ncbi:MAG: hypothetical protein O3A63_05855 [Proteobacteria bacterium]|nr:hypothetical protein [Pseudomonadota bacterium]